MRWEKVSEGEMTGMERERERVRQQLERQVDKGKEMNVTRTNRGN